MGRRALTSHPIGVIARLSDEDGLALLDRALSMDEALLVPAAIDIAARRAEVSP